MKIHCIGSSSSGNSYVITSNGHKLIVELGCNFKEVLKAVDYDLASVAGALCTHRHSDHAAYVHEETLTLLGRRMHGLSAYGSIMIQQQMLSNNLQHTELH